MSNPGWHSIYDIAGWLSIRWDDALELLVDSHIDHRVDKDVPLVASHDVPQLLQAFRRSRCISDRRYEVPQSLRHCRDDWGRTLSRLYDADFTYLRAIAPEQGELLRSLVRNTRAANVVEIGTFVGISTIWLAMGLRDQSARVHTIDKFDTVIPIPPAYFYYLEDPFSFTRLALAEAGVADVVELHRGTSLEMSSQLAPRLTGAVDLIFIDGDHSIAGCLSDFLLYLPLVRAGGYIVLHDIFPEYCAQPGPRHVIDAVVRHLPWLDVVEVDTSPTYFGLAIIRKNTPTGK